MAEGPQSLKPSREALALEIARALDGISLTGNSPDFWETHNLVKAILLLRRGSFAVGIEVAQEVGRHTRLKKVTPDGPAGPLLTVAELRAELEQAMSEAG